MKILHIFLSSSFDKNRLQYSIKNLTYTKKQIMYYIENHLADASSMSLTDIAEENNVSTTTIVRLRHS